MSAEPLNQILEKECPVALRTMSVRGRRLFMPTRGILKQSTDARGKKYNATIGIALDDAGIPLGLPSLVSQLPDVASLPYPPGSGIPELRKLWQKRIFEKNPSLRKSHCTMPVATSGLTHGITVAGTLWIDEGDTVVIPDLFWGNYKLILGSHLGAKIQTFPTFSGDVFNVAGLRDTLSTTEGKKVVVLNFPNNPTGYSPTVTEQQQIADVLIDAAENDDVVVLIDDAYFGLNFEPECATESLFSKLAGAHKNLLPVKIDGITKEDYAWGLRVGFVTVGHPAMSPTLATAFEQKITGVIRSQISMPPHPSQMAALRAMQSPTYADEKLKNFELLHARYNRVREVLATHPEWNEFFTPLPFNSGYFMCVRLANELDTEEVRQILLTKFETGVIATGDLLRVAFSCAPENQIEQIFENIAVACNQVREKHLTE